MFFIHCFLRRERDIKLTLRIGIKEIENIIVTFQMNMGIFSDRLKG